jgi:2-oxoglutarate dehydrogenase E2 component (dihydrolipoamide succinyltransferase)
MVGVILTFFLLATSLTVARSFSHVCRKVADSQMRRAQFHSSHLLQAETVKVPQMAESISEGTLRSWSKQVGDSVEADEEVATIETDKVSTS